jgi:hypothetical protein
LRRSRTPGASKNWSIGPTFTFTAQCYNQNGITRFTQSVLNNTPYFGRWDVGFLAVGASNPGAAVSHGGYVQSGMDAIVTEVDYPSQSSLTGSSNNVNLIWSDPTGQTITGIYSVIANPNSCAIHGTLTRAT